MNHKVLSGSYFYQLIPGAAPPSIGLSLFFWSYPGLIIPPNICTPGVMAKWQVFIGDKHPHLLLVKDLLLASKHYPTMQMAMKMGYTLKCSDASKLSLPSLYPSSCLLQRSGLFTLHPLIYYNCPSSKISLDLIVWLKNPPIPSGKR